MTKRLYRATRGNMGYDMPTEAVVWASSRDGARQALAKDETARRADPGDWDIEPIRLSSVRDRVLLVQTLDG